MPAPRPFRISIIDYLNASPLNYGFKHGLGFEHFHLKYQVPSACSDDLRDGKVDAGLISSIEYLRIPGLQIVPGLCIASPFRVRSVLLLSKVAPESIKTLALDASSRTSVVLAQMLLQERYGARPAVEEMPPDAQAMLAGHDAALIIGDAAMRANREGLMVLDLAEEWHAWTGLPFVFAFWAVAPDAPEVGMPGGPAPFFHQSYELGRKNIEAIIADAWRKFGWTKQELRDYLTKNLSHSLEEMERESLSLFFEKAVRMGFASANIPLRFF